MAAATPYLIAADFNQDGKADVLYTDPQLGQAVVLRADSTQPSGFGSFNGFQIGPVISAPAVADMDRNGFLDIAVVDIGADGIWIGRYFLDIVPLFHPFGPNPIAAALADWSAGKGNDIAIAHGRRGAISFLLNDGGSPPQFSAAAEIPVGGRIERLLAFDANGDGASDLLVGRETALGERVLSILLRSGTGAGVPRFESAVDVPVDADPSSVTLADFDGDGAVDLILSDNPGCGKNSAITRLRGRGDGSFDEPRRDSIPCPFFTGGRRCPLRTFVVGDWNGDHMDDIALFLHDPRNPFGSSALDRDAVHLLQSRGPEFISGPAFLVPRGATAATTGDFNGDGSVDIVASFAGSPQVLLFENQTTPGSNANGVACLSDASCLSGICTEGLCCVQRCGDSESCAVPRLEGTCSKIPESFGCAENVECFDIPEPGDPGNCVDGVCCDEQCERGRCDVFGFSGTCLRGFSPGQECCADDDCDSGHCRDGRCCEDDCQGGYCSNPAGTCTALLALAQGCELDPQCGSGICDRFDRVCCSDVCSEDETCAAAGSSGTCVLTACPGDCDDDKEVSVDELVRVVLISLGRRAAGDCNRADANADGSVTVSELIAAVRGSLEGCRTG